MQTKAMNTPVTRGKEVKFVGHYYGIIVSPKSMPVIMTRTTTSFVHRRAREFIEHWQSPGLMQVSSRLTPFTPCHAFYIDQLLISCLAIMFSSAALSTREGILGDSLFLDLQLHVTLAFTRPLPRSSRLR